MLEEGRFSSAETQRAKKEYNKAPKFGFWSTLAKCCLVVFFAYLFEYVAGQGHDQLALPLSPDFQKTVRGYFDGIYDTDDFEGDILRLARVSFHASLIFWTTSA